ncbi:phage tail sheath family protein [Phytohabitans suffuscus]|uniref:Tail protein n=1 Tax=Phytohabitans suffuscus TaxID=624315 RepID=A0A6F8YY04_9ACTN|nr:phage tail sheath subtilisin-like domain-containing protein [Phytohabitans suffuscus]BCB91055.1 hypothetical protein Psuf_083680 [Phytohabitans suffuscus]
MTTYLSPGVYIEEVPSGPQPIAAAATSVVAILGSTRRGTPLRPTRITGWADFQRTFGGSSAGGFTAEAVYGFFENGGPAAYVVRVDPSLPGTWVVRDTAGADSFPVTATSPGAWSTGLTIAVAPDLTGGQAAAYRAGVTAAVTVTGSATAVAVDSVAGVSVGDTVVLVKGDAAGTTAAAATVTDVAPGTLTVTRSGGANVALVPGDRIAGQVAANATALRFAAGGGVKAGDLLLAETGDRTRTAWRVTAVTGAGAGLVVTVAAAAPGAVPGVQLTDRVARFRGTVGAPTGNTVALGAITWLEDPALRPAVADMTTKLHGYAATGMEGTWAAANHIAFPAPPPAGPIEVEARLRVYRFQESTTLANPTPADLLARYSFVPEGTSIRLSAGPNTATAVRTATSFTITGSTAQTFDTVQFLLPDNASRGVVVRCARPPLAGDLVDFGGNLLEIGEVTNPGGSIYVLGFAATTNISAVAGDAFALRAFVPTTFAPLRFSLAVSGPAGSERFAGLALDPAHPRYFARDGVVNGLSTLVTVAPRAAAAGAPSLSTLPAFAVADQQGLDVTPSTADVKAGLTALEAEPEPALVICPDLLTYQDELLQADLAGALVRHCESFRRLAVVDAPDLADDQALLAWRNTAVASTYAAVYAPHLLIVNLDPDSTDRFRTVPPSGFVAGVMARTDRERGVHKAPGNERVSGIVGLAQQYTQRRQDLLNPGAVNLIRAFPGRGTRIWGARNATDDTTWRYVNVRRLFNFVETSVERGTQWVVFEPNTATTWLRIKASVEGFLDQLWRAGALAGTTAEQAYRVRVGLGQTMTETDIDLGLVVTEVAIAPAKPAEFVVFRFSHKRLSE